MAWSKESRQSRGYGADWEKVRKLVMERDKGLCQVCLGKNRVAVARAVDHVTPKAEAKRLRWSQARTDHPNNLQAICDPCHDEKSAVETGRAYRPKVEIGEDGWPIESVSTKK